ncbi:MAG: sugar ABC transporter permease, partial [Acinetobacter sp.]
DFSQNWFMSKNTAFWAVTIIWLPYAATITILTLAEINAIDSSVFEAASVDGASELQVNFRIILPMLRNIIGTCTVLAATSMLQKFDVIMMTTQGGPLNYTLNLPLYIYQTALTNNDFARANTAGVYLIIMGFITLLFINRVFRMGKSDL